MIEHEFYEDSYSGYEFESWQEFLDQFAMCEDDLYARWNVPVWIHRDTDNGRVECGVMLTRHGTNVIWWVADPGEPAYRELQERMLRVWAGRADIGFDRYPPLPEMVGQHGS